MGRLWAWVLVVALLPALGSGCATLNRKDGRPLVPAQVLTQTGPYRIWTNGPIEADAPAVRELAALEIQVQRELGVRVDPDSTPIEVYILDNERTFQHFLRFYYPELPSRRAFFLARGDRRVVYTYFGGRLEEDLRHEAAHALLNGSIPNLPLWLDEGLAEYFEVEESQAGLNREHLARLPGDRDRGWTPDLDRLEKLHDVREMTPRDYRESWAWAHYLLSGPTSNRTALLSYLADLKLAEDARVAPLSERIAGDAVPSSSALLAYLDEIEPRRPAIAVQNRQEAGRAMVYRLQNPAADPPSRTTRVSPSERSHTAPSVAQPAPRRRGLLGAFFDIFR